MRPTPKQSNLYKTATMNQLPDASGLTADRRDARRRMRARPTHIGAIVQMETTCARTGIKKHSLEKYLLRERCIMHRKVFFFFKHIWIDAMRARARGFSLARSLLVRPATYANQFSVKFKGKYLCWFFRRCRAFLPNIRMVIHNKYIYCYNTPFGWRLVIAMECNAMRNMTRQAYDRCQMRSILKRTIQ